MPKRNEAVLLNLTVTNDIFFSCVSPIFLNNFKAKITLMKRAFWINQGLISEMHLRWLICIKKPADRLVGDELSIRGCVYFYVGTIGTKLDGLYSL